MHVVVSCKPVEDTDAMYFHVSAYCDGKLGREKEQLKLVCVKFGVAWYDRLRWSDGCVGKWVRRVRMVLLVCDERGCGLR